MIAIQILFTRTCNLVGVDRLPLTHNFQANISGSEVEGALSDSHKKIPPVTYIANNGYQRAIQASGQHLRSLDAQRV